MKIHKVTLTLPVAAMILAVMAAVGTTIGCGGNHAPDELDNANGKTVVGVDHTRPGWNVEDMVKRSDAVVIGSFTADLGDKQKTWGGSQSRLNINYDFKDYQLAVERVIYSKGDLESDIAVLVEAGISSPGNKVLQPEDIPSFQADERMLLFLESLKDYDDPDGVGRPVPKGFSENTYYRLIMGSLYGKLLADGDKWEDSITGKEVTVEQIADAVREYKDTSK